MRPFATDVAYSVVCVWSMCLCVSHKNVLCQKTAELTEVPFRGLTHVGPRNYVLDVSRDLLSSIQISGSLCCGQCFPA